jgi:stringent starvation protein B
VGPRSQRPYLLRAMHEWMVDNGFTPHLVVDARRDGVHVPPAHVQDGKIVLNVSPAATRDLSLGNELVTFEARFGGVPERLSIPIAAVQGIYARETGQGMLFGDEESPPPEPGGSPPAGPGAPEKSRPKLKVIK